MPDLYLSGPWHPWPADGIAVDFDEAQTLYARTDRAGGCSIRRVTDDAEIYRLPPLGWPAYPSLSQDGKFIVLTQFNRSVSISTAILCGNWRSGTAPNLVGAESTTGGVSRFATNRSRVQGRLDRALRAADRSSSRPTGTRYDYAGNRDGPAPDGAARGGVFVPGSAVASSRRSDGQGARLDAANRPAIESGLASRRPNPGSRLQPASNSHLRSDHLAGRANVGNGELSSLVGLRLEGRPPGRKRL